MGAYKAMVVHIARDLGVMIDCLRKVDKHISDEGDLDPRAIAAFVPETLGRAIDPALTADLPRDARSFVQGFNILMKTTRGALVTIGDCIQTRKKCYHEHLRKMRDISNAATRNAVLVSTNIPTSIRWLESSISSLIALSHVRA